MATKKLAPPTQNSPANSIDSTDTHSCPTCDDTNVLRARIDAAAQAQKRSRGAFLASTIMSLAILIAMWNAYGSWYRSFMFEDASTQLEPAPQATPMSQISPASQTKPIATK